MHDRSHTSAQPPLDRIGDEGVASAPNWRASALATTQARETAKGPRRQALGFTRRRASAPGGASARVRGEAQAGGGPLGAPQLLAGARRFSKLGAKLAWPLKWRGGRDVYGFAEPPFVRVSKRADVGTRVRHRCLRSGEGRGIGDEQADQAPRSAALLCPRRGCRRGSPRVRSRSGAAFGARFCVPIHWSSHLCPASRVGIDTRDA
jgi:hypothetical protein